MFLAFLCFLSSLKKEAVYASETSLDFHPISRRYSVRGINDLNTGVSGMWDKINFKETMK